MHPSIFKQCSETPEQKGGVGRSLKRNAQIKISTTLGISWQISKKTQAHLLTKNGVIAPPPFQSLCLSPSFSFTLSLFFQVGELRLMLSDEYGVIAMVKKRKYIPTSSLCRLLFPQISLWSKGHLSCKIQLISQSSLLGNPIFRGCAYSLMSAEQCCCQNKLRNAIYIQWMCLYVDIS